MSKSPRIPFPYRIPFVEELGLELHSVGDGRAELRVDLAEAHLNESLDLTEDGKALRASHAMLTDILGREGLERVDQAGVPFDPSVHDAVAHSEGDGGEGGTVVEEVLRSGYRWKGQVLRPAMVRVRG